MRNKIRILALVLIINFLFVGCVATDNSAVNSEEQKRLYILQKMKK